MKRALVTGAGGFIGGGVVRRFLAEGWFVHAMVRRNVPPALKELQAQGRLELLPLDMTDFPRLRESMEQLPRLDAVVHCAARASDVGRDSAFRLNNLEAVKELAVNALRLEAGIFVFVSTTDVYGLRDFSGETEDELDYDRKTANPYPRYKILAEEWLKTNLPPERYSIVRPAAVWGKDDPTLTRRIRNFLAVSPWIIHFGPWKGANRWPLAHVERVGWACFMAATHPDARGLAFHVLDPERASMEEVYRRVAREYFPEKRFLSIFLPLWCGLIPGALSTFAARVLNLEHPPWDPSLYALHSVSRNLDFSPARFEKLLASFEKPFPLAEGERPDIGGTYTKPL